MTRFGPIVELEHFVNLKDVSSGLLIFVENDENRKDIHTFFAKMNEIVETFAFF